MYLGTLKPSPDPLLPDLGGRRSFAALNLVITIKIVIKIEKLLL
jgi:hypothetical protein